MKEWVWLAGAAAVYLAGRALIGRWGAKGGARREWEVDEGVSPEDEEGVGELLARYGKSAAAALSEGMELEASVRAFAERYAALEFDERTRDYDRAELLKGECGEKWLKGFYCIGSDGGDLLFLARKSVEDGRIYAYDMDGGKRPEPYAGNVGRFVAMRHKAWRKNAEKTEEGRRGERGRISTKGREGKKGEGTGEDFVKPQRMKGRE